MKTQSGPVGRTIHKPSTAAIRVEPPSERVMRILAEVRRIPRGRVATYGDVAMAAGMPRRARLVGRVLRSEPLAADVPWYRVVGAGGVLSIPEDASCAEQRRRLTGEGVIVRGRRVVDFEPLRIRRYRSGNSAGSRRSK